MEIPPYSIGDFFTARSYVFHELAHAFFTGSLVRYSRAHIKVNRKTNQPNQPHLFTAFSNPGEPPLSPTRSHLLWVHHKTLFSRITLRMNELMSKQLKFNKKISISTLFYVYYFLQCWEYFTNGWVILLQRDLELLFYGPRRWFFTIITVKERFILR